MPLSSRCKLEIVAFDVRKLLVHPSPCEVPTYPGSAAHCCAAGVAVLRYMYRTRKGAIKTAHEVQCDKHLAEWRQAHGEQLLLFPA